MDEILSLLGLQPGAQLFGLSAHAVADSVVVFVSLFMLKHAGRFALWAAKCPFREKGLAEEEAEEGPPLSPACAQALEALASSEPAYDSEVRWLRCDGLYVQFDPKCKDLVARLVGAPAVHPVNGTVEGVNLANVLNEHEAELVREHAVALRDEVVRRDKERDNREAARTMHMARLQGGVPADYVLSMYDAGEPGPEELAALEREIQRYHAPLTVGPRANAPTYKHPNKKPLVGGLGPSPKKGA